MRSATYMVTAYMTVDRDGEEVQLTLRGRYTEDEPSRTYGPPESCFEGEPASVDVLTVLDENGRAVELTLDEEETAVERLLLAGADDMDDISDMDPPERDDYDYDEDRNCREFSEDDDDLLDL